MTTAREVGAMLRRHYLPEGRPPGGVLADEIGAPDGRRRADALWAPFTIAGGEGLVGHEIKVTRSDVLAELADPTKAEPWGQYCARWWLTVSDPALVTGLDIPEAWGIMAPPSGRRTRSMTILRPAPLRKVGDTGPAWRRLAAWYHYRTADVLVATQRDLAWRERDIARLEEQVRNRQLAGEGSAHPQALRIAAILRGLDAGTRQSYRGAGVYLTGDEINDDDVVAALLDLAQTRAMTRETGYEIDRLVRAAKTLAEPMGDVEKHLVALRKEVNA